MAGSKSYYTSFPVGDRIRFQFVPHQVDDLIGEDSTEENFRDGSAETLIETELPAFIRHMSFQAPHNGLTCGEPDGGYG